MRLFLCLILLLMPSPSFAQAQEGLDRRLELAQKMLEINPVRDQVRMAIERYINAFYLTAPESEQARFRVALENVLNFKALEQITLDAYIDTYTQEELEAMVAYYALPEAKSARAKQQQFNDRVYPEMIRMLDQTLIRARTAGE